MISNGDACPRFFWGFFSPEHFALHSSHKLLPGGLSGAKRTKSAQSFCNTPNPTPTAPLNFTHWRDDPKGQGYEKKFIFCVFFLSFQSCPSRTQCGLPPLKKETETINTREALQADAMQWSFHTSFYYWQKNVKDTNFLAI